MLLKLFLSTCLLLLSLSSYSGDYQELSWETNKKDVARLLPKNKNNNYNFCEGNSSDMIGDPSTLELLYAKVTSYLPNYHWAHVNNQKVKFDHDSKYSRERFGDGCALFYNDRLVAFKIDFYSKSFNDVLKIYEEKYGKFTKEAGGFLGKDIFYFETPRTFILLAYESSKYKTPVGFYFSKVSREQIVADQKKYQIKDKPSAEEDSKNLKNKI